ncbi:MAG: methionyl-tRNA formyltransferase, partial [Gemmatimonadetes bacterium]|nr:methionyl-tRNA formyltransferase [Gemmatimonadota bacterium]
MRIVIIGQAAFGRTVLERIVEAGRDEVAGVFTVLDAPGHPADPLREAAQAASIPVYQPARLRSPEAVGAFRRLAADLCVMAYVTGIVPLDIIEAPRLGTIQYHPSLLPLHRGPSSINWAIISGDTRT